MKRVEGRRSKLLKILKKILYNSYLCVKCYSDPTWNSIQILHKLFIFQYPTKIKEFVLSSVRDLTTGYDSSTIDKKAILPSSSSSEMITFNFTNGSVITLRTSGTEPKIKYYSEMCANLDKQ